jgi:hypothetical protein
MTIKKLAAVESQARFAAQSVCKLDGKLEMATATKEQQ